MLQLWFLEMNASEVVFFFVRYEFHNLLLDQMNKQVCQVCDY